MREFVDIERRIDRSCSPASIAGEDSRTLAEIGDVLASGYALALWADGRCQRHAVRIERLASNDDDAHRAYEIRRLTCECRTIEAATRELRDRLGLVRVLFAHVNARVDPS